MRAAAVARLSVLISFVACGLGLFVLAESSSLAMIAAPDGGHHCVTPLELWLGVSLGHLSPLVGVGLVALAPGLALAGGVALLKGRRLGAS